MHGQERILPNAEQTRLLSMVLASDFCHGSAPALQTLAATKSYVGFVTSCHFRSLSAIRERSAKS
eukprot:5662266-Amphidinium_carterae.1